MENNIIQIIHMDTCQIYGHMSNATAHAKMHVFIHQSVLTAYMVSQIHVNMREKIYLVPRVFSQKGTDVLIFGHR